MIRSADGLSARDGYSLLIDSIVPRPIAWVSTRSAEGTPNLAPFSFFTGVTGAPPTLVFSVVPRSVRGPDGRKTSVEKDTLVNVRATGEFIVHAAPKTLRSQVVATSGDHPPDVDEIELVGLETVPGTWVDVPRVVSLPVAMECRLLQLIPVGRLPAVMVLGEVLGWHLRDDLVDAAGRIPSAGWGPLARLGIEGYLT